MAQKRARSSHRLNQRWWKFALAEWIGLSLGFLVIVLLFCLFFIRRQTLPYHLEHTFAVRDPEFFGSALALCDPVPIAGNKIELLSNGDEYFPAMLQAIRSAQHAVNFAAYILDSDEIGHQFRDAFCERAQNGVEVRLLLDGIGSAWNLDNSDVRMLRKAGCKFSYYHPTASWRADRTNRRSHRRILVVDGKVGFTGSAGFGIRWAGHAEDKNHWRDLQARMEGPIVAKLQWAFEEHWVKTYGETLSGAHQFPALETAGELKAQVVASRSFSVAPIPLIQATAFAAAEKRIAAIEPLAAATVAPFMTEREAPRVPFAALIERGMIVPGTRLRDAKRKVSALVRADGAIAIGEAVGSIHRIGALAQGLDACNGWTFWHLETPAGLVCIDTLRAAIRAEGIGKTRAQ